MSLFIRPVQRTSHAIDIAAVRNSGREFMTHDSSFIDADEQAEWFKNVYLPAFRANEMFAFAGYVDDEPAAYGMVKKSDGKFWLTGVIHTEFRGQGLGEELFKFLTDFVLNRAEEVWLDVLQTNVPAQKLYLKLGYQPIAEEGDVFVMRKGVV